MYELRDGSRSVKEARDEQLAAALREIGAIAAGYGRERITGEGRVRTGRMRGSVGFALGENAVVIGTNVSYAPEHELGTARLRGIHFLRDALQEHMDEYEEIIRKER